MISSRLVQINDEASSTGKKLRKIYEDLDISVYDANGQLRSTFDILQDLSEKWATLDDNQRQYIALTSAGANQIQNFYALMTNFSTAVEATATAEQSLGSAWQENDKYMESIEAKTQKLKTSLEGLVLGNGGLQKLVGNILDLSTKIVNLVDSMGGLAVVIPTLTGLIIALNSKAIGGFLANVPKIITGLIEITGYILGLNTAGIALESTMALATGGVGLAIIAITTVIGLLVKSSKALEENESALASLNSEVNNQKNEIDELNEKLKDLKWNLFDLTNQEISITDEQDIKNLAVEIAQLEEELKIKQSIYEINQREQERLAREILNDKNRTVFDNESDFQSWSTSTGFNGVEYNTQATTLLNLKPTKNSDNYNKYIIDANDNLDDRIKKYTNSYTALRDKLAEVVMSTNDSYELATGEVVNKEEYISRLNKEMKEYQGILDELIPSLYDSVAGLDENSEYYQRAMTTLDYYNDAMESNLTKQQKEQQQTQTVNKFIDSLKKSYGLTSEQVVELNKRIDERIDSAGDEADAIDIATEVGYEYINELKEQEEEQERLSKSWSSWNEDMDNLQSAYETLSTAQDEFNSAQGISIDTLQSLLNLSPEYLACLEEENGQYRFNIEALKQLAIQHIQDGKAKLYEDACSKIQKLSEDESRFSTEKTTNALGDNTKALKDNTNAKIDNAKANMYQAMSESGFENFDEAYQIIQNTEKQVALLDKALLSVDKDFDSAFSGAETKANKAREATNELKDAVNELQNEIKKYETAITYINKKIDEQIDKLEEAKDAELDAIDKRIDALEEAQDAEEKYWDEKIQALQEQNDALEDQLELEKLLEELETAKNTKVRVYREGQGFVWEADQDAIGKVNEKIEEYNRKQKYEQQLAELEKFKQDALDNYEAQIEDLENYKTQVEENYDAQIKVFEDYKNQFEKQVDSYEDEQSRLLALQLTGIDFENDNWTTRLSNLNSFVDAYKAKLKELEEAQNAQNVISSSSSSSSSSYSGGTGGGGGKYKVNGQEFASQSEAEKYANAQIANEINAFRQNVSRAYNSGTPMSQSYIDSTEQSIRNKYKISKYASGIGSVGDNQFALVGDSPNQELVIGSRLNGSLVNLKRGSGVVNAQSTNTLASLFNSIGGKGLKNIQSSDGFNGTNISIGNITLPEVKNGQDFVDYLQNFSNRMIQRAYAR